MISEEMKVELIKKHMAVAMVLEEGKVPKEAVDALYNDIMPLFEDDTPGALSILQILMRLCKENNKPLMRELLIQHADLAKMVVRTLSRKKDEDYAVVAARQDAQWTEQKHLIELAGYPIK